MNQRRSPIGSDSQERTRYFPRQVVTPPDLAQDREYLLHRHRRHNRLLHGWGIVLGLEVTAVPPKPAKLPTTATTAETKANDLLDSAYRAFVKECGNPDEVGAGAWIGVKAGYAVTPRGDEVYLPGGILVNAAVEMNGSLVVQPAGCRTDLAPHALSREGAYYLIVEATESEARPVRAAGARCGDHPDQFEFSRLRDGIQFRLASKDLVKLALTAPERLTGNLIKPTTDILVLSKVEFEAGKIKSVTTDDKRSIWTSATLPAV